MNRLNLVGFLLGGAFGFLVAAGRLHDYDVIHNMLLLREPDLFLLMASAIGVAAPLLWLLERRGFRTPLGGRLERERAPIARRHIVGSAVFGAGWALAGTCPVPALAMTAGGNVLGAVVAAGLFAGILLREATWARLGSRRPAPPAAQPEPAAAAAASP